MITFIDLIVARGASGADESVCITRFDTSNDKTAIDEIPGALNVATTSRGGANVRLLAGVWVHDKARRAESY